MLGGEYKIDLSHPEIFRQCAGDSFIIEKKGEARESREPHTL